MARPKSRSRGRKPRVERDDYLGVRLPPELRARIIELAEHHQMTTSEWLRAVLFAAIDSPTGLGAYTSEDQGYVAGRKLGLRLAQEKIAAATQDLPASYEDALAQLMPEG